MTKANLLKLIAVKRMIVSKTAKKILTELIKELDDGRDD